MRRTTQISTPLLMLLVLTLLLPGCQRWKARKAAKQYAEEIQSSNRQLLELNKSLTRFNQNTASAKVLRLYLKDEVFPKWSVYLRTLRGVQTGSAELAQIHQLLVDAHAQQYQAQQSLLDGLTDKNLADRVRTLKTSVPTLKQREGDYLKRIRSYYKKYGLKIKE